MFLVFFTQLADIVKRTVRLISLISISEKILSFMYQKNLRYKTT